ncbi:UDP-glycosyltransferase UGT5-like [Cloeon dipterum]|uniref:UDP-glycosyltransferase UGT5-like n=1 Tax=Cloeon dipterum TaxID=197152 RepID=UPI00321F82A4
MFLNFGILMLALVSTAQCARILCIFPWPGTSHMITFSALTRALAERGHEVVVVSTHPLKNPPKNYSDINTFDNLKDMYDEMMNSDDIFEFEDVPIIFHPIFYWMMGVQSVELTFQNEDVQALVQDQKGFDLVIAEDFVCDAIFAFAHHFKAPLIVISSFGGYPWQNYAVGNPYNPAYCTNNLLPFADKKNFVERLINTAYTILWNFGSYFYYYPRQNQLVEQLFGPGFPSVAELRRTASLSMTNSHFSTNYVRPLVPAFVEVGGMHVKAPSKPLPPDMKQWLDDAKDGAIYFSLGSNVRSSLLPEEKRTALMQAFAQIPQRVLWKWETDDMPGKPENVMISNWVPQMEVLAHPNVKLFISHGGLLSGQEAMFSGVPIVGIPFFGDQRMNVERAENEGYGVFLPYKEITIDSVLAAIRKGLHDKNIQKEVKRRQAVFLDQPQSPLERAVFWTEYVLRHSGAAHLRSAALDLSWYQLELLDVYAFMAAIALLFLSLCYLLLFKLFCRKNKTKID